MFGGVCFKAGWWRVGFLMRGKEGKRRRGEGKVYLEHDDGVASYDLWERGWTLAECTELFWGRWDVKVEFRMYL